MTMRALLACLCSAALLAGCGPKALTLSEDPIDRAATCGVVAAAEARAGSAEIKQALPFEAQGRILHHALVAATEGGTFSGQKASAVSRRMSELQGEITAGKWQELAPACGAAFPEAGKTEVNIPGSRFDAQLGCDELAEFMMTALEGQKRDYGNELAEYRDLRQRFNAVLGPGLRARAGADLQAQQAERRKALAAVARLGSPVAVMKQCVERFG
jgi:hypothetical protein